MSATNPHLKLLSIQTGKIKSMNVDGRTIKSAIEKKPRKGRIAVTALGIQGDQQADPSVHGGIDKAIYAYPIEHYPYWQEQTSSALQPGALGENLTLSGLLEQDVYVGDKLHFSDCSLRITQPRKPCHKFNIKMNDRLAGKKMARTGYCGFYLAVSRAGSLEAGEEFKIESGPRQTAISELFRVAMFQTRND